MVRRTVVECCASSAKCPLRTLSQYSPTSCFILQCGAVKTSTSSGKGAIFSSPYRDARPITAIVRRHRDLFAHARLTATRNRKKVVQVSLFLAKSRVSADKRLTCPTATTYRCLHCLWRSQMDLFGGFK